MHGLFSIAGHHGSRLRCVVYFLLIIIYAHAICLLTTGESNFSRVLSCYHGKLRLINQVFRKYLVFFPDLFALKLNIKKIVGIIGEQSSVHVSVITFRCT